jgi:hypothetical protein
MKRNFEDLSFFLTVWFATSVIVLSAIALAAKIFLNF